MADLIFAKLEISLREYHLKILKLLSVKVTQTPATRLDHWYSILTDGKLNIFKTTSDHYGIILTTDIKINKTPKVKTKSRKINSIPLAELRTFLGRKTWFYSKSTEYKYKLSRNLLITFPQYMPRKNISKVPKPIHIVSNLNILRERLFVAQNKYFLTKAKEIRWPT